MGSICTLVLFLISSGLLGIQVFADQCQIFDQRPNVTLANETICQVRSGPDGGCFDCIPFGWSCCDDGSSTVYDKFCRYPPECCKEQYCGDQCCNSSHGIPCGEVCAPLAYTCCNSKTAQLCKKPDTCCGDHCCPNNYFCCNTDDVCCETGTTCCPGKNGTKCCPPGTECCGDHCCLSHEGDVCQAGQSCCPGDRLCGDELCCPAGQFCKNEVCCDNQVCGGTNRCCHEGSHCNPEGGCCGDNQHFCSHGSIDNCFDPPYTRCCSDGGACTPDFPVCTGDFCCPTAYPKICSDQRLCHGDNWGNCACCGGDECCYPPYGCDGGDCKYCYHTGHWWWKKTVCEYQPNHAAHSDPLERPHIPAKLRVKRSKPKTIPLNTDPARAFIASVSRVKRYMVPMGPGPVKIRSGSSHSVKTGVVLPPAPSKIRSPKSFACFQNNQALQDACTAFPCMAQMLDCGKTGYIKAAEALYCDGVVQYEHLFNSEGQTFLKCLQTCVTSHHVAIFNQGIIPCCYSLEAWGTGSMQEDCFKSCKFCAPLLFLTNAGAFDTLFNNDGTTNIYQLWYKICQIELQ